MTLPRPVIPGTTSLVTRRCIQRQFLLRPSPFVNQVLLYCMGLAQQRSGVAIHAVCAMSSHLHITVTDANLAGHECIQRSKNDERKGHQG